MEPLIEPSGAEAIPEWFVELSAIDTWPSATKWPRVVVWLGEKGINLDLAESAALSLLANPVRDKTKDMWRRYQTFCKNAKAWDKPLASAGLQSQWNTGDADERLRRLREDQV